MNAHRSRATFVFALALALGASGCAAGAGSGGGARPAGATTNRIVQAELEGLTDLTAYQAIQRLRSRWLQTRSGQAPVLYVDGGRRNDINDLRTMRAAEISEMEYLSASDASNRYGTDHTGGAILVTSRR